MKNILVLLLLTFSFSAFSQLNRDPYRDSDEGNFYLRNGKAFFQRTYNAGGSFESLQEKLTSYNLPNSGFQVKKVEGDKMNGVLLNYHLNWNYTDLKSKKIPEFLKYPANATFEIEKNGNAYQVTINNIWFTNPKGAKNQKLLTLESIVTGKGGVVFTKNKRELRALKMIDENFQEMFKIIGTTKDTRF